MPRKTKIKPISEELLAKIEKAVQATQSKVYVSRSTLNELLVEVYQATGRAK